MKPESLIIAISLLATLSAQASFAGEKSSYKQLLPRLDSAPPSKRKYLEAKINQDVHLSSEKMGNPWGYLPFNAALPQQVSQVAPESPAYKSGLRAGDKIISARTTGNRADLVVEREKKKYACKMELPVLDREWKLKASANKQEKSALENAQLVLMVDSSASMNTRDCPDGLSRWQWCKKQAADLYKNGQPQHVSKISISTFNSQMRSTNNCKFSELERVFQEKLPEGETIMAPAIEDAVNTVNSQLYSGKPAVIAVITDGRPSDVDAVKKRIVQTANSLRDSNLLTLAFIEIGTPERYLAEFDNALVKQGAKEDIVTVFPFAQVNSQGLSKTLELAIESRQAQKQAALQAKPEQKPQQRQSANSEPQEEDSTPKPPPPSPPKPKAPQESEQDRLTREKREQEDRKMRRSAANQSYDFSQKRSPATPQSKPAAKATSAPSRPLEVDEKEAVRKQQSNRNY